MRYSIMITQRHNKMSSKTKIRLPSYQATPRIPHTSRQSKSYQSIVQQQLLPEKLTSPARQTRRALPNIWQDVQGWEASNDVQPSSNFLTNLSSNLLSYEAMQKKQVKMIRYKTDESVKRKAFKEIKRIEEKQQNEHEIAQTLETRRKAIRQAVVKKYSVVQIPAKIYDGVTQEILSANQDCPTSRHKKVSSLFKKYQLKDPNIEQYFHLPELNSNRDHHQIHSNIQKLHSTLAKDRLKAKNVEGQVDPFGDHLLFRIR